VQSQGYTVTAGDTLKFIYNGWGGGNIDPYKPLDQLPGNRWFTIIGPVDNSQFWRTYYIQCTSADHIAFPAQCPVANGPWTGFTRGGVPITLPENGHNPKFRFQYDPGPGQGYVNNNYSQYGGQTINGLAVLGFNISHALSDFAARCPPGACYNPAMPSNWWDPTIVVPGLPTPHNGL
jgi:hypothetical protein